MSAAEGGVSKPARSASAQTGITQAARRQRLDSSTSRPSQQGTEPYSPLDADTRAAPATHPRRRRLRAPLNGQGLQGECRSRRCIEARPDRPPPRLASRAARRQRLPTQARADLYSRYEPYSWLRYAGCARFSPRRVRVQANLAFGFDTRAAPASSPAAVRVCGCARQQLRCSAAAPTHPAAAAQDLRLVTTAVDAGWSAAEAVYQRSPPDRPAPSPASQAARRLSSTQAQADLPSRYEPVLAFGFVRAPASHFRGRLRVGHLRARPSMRAATTPAAGCNSSGPLTPWRLGQRLEQGASSVRSNFWPS